MMRIKVKKWKYGNYFGVMSRVFFLAHDNFADK
jgi:hypothetical protein